MAPLYSVVRYLFVPLVAATAILRAPDQAPAISSRGNAPDVVTEVPLIADPLVNGTNIKSRAGTFFLRIMPLGASITEGVVSPDRSGYRKWIRDQLRFSGWKVNMIGSKVNGSLRDRVCGPFTIYFHSFILVNKRPRTG